MSDDNHDGIIKVENDWLKADPEDLRVYASDYSQDFISHAVEYECFRHGNVGNDVVYLGGRGGDNFCGQCLRELLDHYCVERVKEVGS